MGSNLALDNQLVQVAMRIGGHRTKKAAVTQALTEYIQRRKQRAILDLFGTLDLAPVSELKRQRGAAMGMRRHRQPA